MPHSIRDFYLNNSLASGNYSSSSNYNTISPSSAFGVNSLGHSTTNNASTSSSSNNNPPSATGSINTNNSPPPPRGYSSSFNTTYNINPSTLPSYSYTNRYLQQQRPSSSSTSSGGSAAPARMPQYPPPQYQYYSNANNANNANNTASSTAGSYTPGGYVGGVGYSSTYYGGGNSDRYNSSFSSHSIGSGN
ncbi:hypothetical protein BGZ90_008061, partial [Linnemannia elongata]